MIFFDKEKSWILNHEKILIVIAVLIAVVYLGGKFIDTSHEKAIARNAVAQAVLQDRVEKNEAIAKQIVTQLQQYQDLVTSLSAQNTALAKASTQRHAELKKQQEIDKTLPLPELAIRWQNLANLQPESIKTTDTGFTVTEDGSRATVHILETVPVLQKDLADAHTVIANKDRQLAGATGLVAGLQAQVSGLQIELVDKDKACKTELNLEKSKARKSKLRWFVTGVGVGAGIVVRLLL